jgi:hypothetical protein
MRFIVNTAVIFAVATAALLLMPTNAAPTAADLHTLPYVPFNPAGQIQQDSVPDPGIGDWFTSIFDGFTKIIQKGLKNQDPEKIEEVRKYVKRTRSFVTPVANFIQQFYPNDVAAGNVINAINSFLASLEKMVDQPTRIAMSQNDVESLAKVMRMLEAVTS